MTSTTTVFFDDFEDGSLGSDWTLTGLGSGGVSSDTSQSGIYSAYHCHNEGSIESTTLDLSSYSTLYLSYWIQKGGPFGESEVPESGENLVVEYYSDSSSWVELETYYGGGTEGEIYTYNSSLPAGAYHSNFHLRFRQTSGSGSDFDYWHIDDVEICTSSDSGNLGDAIESSGLTFTSGGANSWSIDSVEWYSGGSSARSGDIDHDEESWVRTTVDGPCRISFRWKVSSEPGYDYLEFWVDSERIDQISGDDSWTLVEYEISDSGSHTLEWRYDKDESLTGGSDCGWIDYVSVSSITGGGNGDTTPVDFTLVAITSGITVPIILGVAVGAVYVKRKEKPLRITRETTTEKSTTSRKQAGIPTNKSTTRRRGKRTDFFKSKGREKDTAITSKKGVIKRKDKRTDFFKSKGREKGTGIATKKGVAKRKKSTKKEFF